MQTMASQQNRQTQVVIIGAGLTGLSTAFF